MQERITMPSGEDRYQSDCVVVQYSPDLMSVGLGIEYNDLNGVPGSYGIVDVIYGSDENLAEIGKLFREKLSGVEILLNDKDLGRMILDAVTGSNDSFNSAWVWLDRPATNRAVRLLRKARDSAFGRDE